MPRLTARSTSTGMQYMIDSSDPETICRWLLETLDRIQPEQHHPMQVSINGIWARSDLEQTEKSDWTMDNRLHGATHLSSAQGTQGLRELAQQLLLHAELHDQQEAEAKAEVEADEQMVG